MIYLSNNENESYNYMRDMLDISVYIEREERLNKDFFDSSDLVMEKAGDNDEHNETVLAKIGEFVSTLAKKFIEFINGIMNSLSNFGFANKSEISKAEKLIKRHPEFRDTVIEGMRTGALDMRDMNSMKELEEASLKLFKMASSNNIDSSTLKGKFEILKKKLKETITLDKTSKVITTAAGAVSLFVALSTMKDNIKITKNCAKESEMKVKQMEDCINKVNDPMIAKILRDEFSELSKNMTNLYGSKFKNIKSDMSRLSKAISGLEKKLGSNNP